MTQERHVERGAAKGPGVRILAVIGGVALGVVAGAVIWIVALSGGVALRSPEVAQTGSAGAQSTQGLAGSSEPGTGSTSAVGETGAETTGVGAPGFDTVRAEGDGSVVVAGRASARAVVTIEVNGAAAAEAQADGQGRFAAFLSLAPGENPNVVTLSAKGIDGTVTRSAQSVILKPVEAPMATAGAEAGAAPDAVTGTETGSGAPEAAAPVLLADAEAVRKLAAGASASVVIDTISYGADGAVELSGRAVAGAGPHAGTHVRIYLDNAEAGTAPVAGDGHWTLRLRDIAPRVYALRVDQLDENGKVVSRFETPFQREDTAKLADAGAGSEPVPGQVDPGAETASAASSAAAVVPPPVEANIITVQPGYTLWAIAKSSYGDGLLYVKVFEANRDQIRNPDLIYPGQVFSVPRD
jgi:nucleoid-associated protein YgaU